MGPSWQKIHRDDHYDFQRQQSYSMDVAVLPGDRLIIHCVWNSMARTKNTTGGESSSQEMCVVIFQYYPAPSLKSCSDGGSGKTASCSGRRVNISPYEYTPLPMPQSTCESGIGGEESPVTNTPWLWVGSVILVVALLGVLMYKKQ